MTLSYASGVSATPLLGDTIGANLAKTVAAFPDRDVQVERASGRRGTYGHFADDVAAVALGRRDLDIVEGDPVGIWAPNCAEWMLVQYATAKLGAILVDINPAYRLHELEFVLNQAGIRTLVSAKEFKTSDYAAMIEEARPRSPAAQDVR